MVKPGLQVYNNDHVVNESPEELFFQFGAPSRHALSLDAVREQAPCFLAGISSIARQGCPFITGELCGY